MRAVNLLPRDAPTRRFGANRGVVFLGGGGAALVTVALAALMLGASGAADTERQRLDLVNAQLLAVPRPARAAAEPHDDAALAAEKAARIASLSSALAGRIAWDEVLRQFSQVLPEDVWLSALSSSAAVPDAGSKLTLSGSTYSHDGVARFLTRLSVLPSLTNVQLQSSNASGASGVVTFVVVADVKAPGSGATS